MVMIPTFLFMQSRDIIKVINCVNLPWASDISKLTMEEL